MAVGAQIHQTLLRACSRGDSVRRRFGPAAGEGVSLAVCHHLVALPPSHVHHLRKRAKSPVLSRCARRVAAAVRADCSRRPPLVLFHILGRSICFRARTGAGVGRQCAWARGGSCSGGPRPCRQGGATAGLRTEATRKTHHLAKVVAIIHVVDFCSRAATCFLHVHEVVVVLV